MKGFALSDNNDLVIQNGELQLVEGTDLLRQTVQTVLNTNKGEWFLDEDEGINFRNILGKKTSGTKANDNDSAYIAQYEENEKELSKLLENRLDGVT